MLINSKELSTFNSKLEKKQIGTSSLEVKQDWVDTMLRPILFSINYKYIPLQISIITLGDSRQQMEQTISNMTKELSNCTIKFKDIDFYFKATLSSITLEYLGETEDGFYATSILVEMLSEYKYKSDFTHISNKELNTAITYNGNIEALATIEIVPMADAVDIVIEGLTEIPIKVKNIKGNKVLCINGEEGLVTEDGINKFQDAELWEFPKLKIGHNPIRFSRNSCNIKIKYKEYYV